MPLMPLSRSFTPLVLAVVMSSLGTAALARAADPTLSDCIQANETAIKLRNESKLRQARAQWLVCAAESCNVEIRDTCKSRVSEVNKAIPTVVFDAKDDEGRDVTGVSVTMDDQPLAPRLEGTAISLDPGEHNFRFQMAGQPAVEKTLVIAEGVKERHETIVLGRPGTTVTATAAAANQESFSPSADNTPSAAPTAPGVRSNTKTVGLVVGSVGAAALAVGGVFGALSFSKWSSAQTACKTSVACANHAQAMSDKNDAATNATVSTVGFVAGGLAVAAGVTLFLLAPGSGGNRGAAVNVAPSIGPGSAGAVLQGVF
jgi:hypothetical protein